MTSFFRSKVVFAAILLLATLSPLHSANWRADVFREGQQIFLEFDKKEADIMVSLAPSTAEFYRLWIAMKEARQKVDSLAFSHQLKNNAAIDWSNPWNWLEPLSSSNEEERLIQTDPMFKEAFREFMERRDALYSRPELFKERNKVFADNRKKFMGLEKELEKRLHDLQEIVEKHLKEMP
jgi:hypothetical protein